MKVQFTILKVFELQLFVAALFVFAGMFPLGPGDGTFPHGWPWPPDVLFMLVLLGPVWVPLFLLDKAARKSAGVRPFLALAAAGWYLILLSFIYPPAPHNVYCVVDRFLQWTLPYDTSHSVASLVDTVLLRVAPVGSVAACAALTLCARGWWQILAVPLFLAIVAGTVSVELWW
jgi:hypothetical protein